jgi:RNA polymerase sigma-70 factor (ECF subfamily)
MSEAGSVVGPNPADLLLLYDRALPDVYSYLLARCRSVPVAEDLTSETFLAAVKALDGGTVPVLSVAWLIGVARHKLVDHWRRLAREEAKLSLVASEPQLDDPWEARLESDRAREVLDSLGPHHRGALVLRYVDGLPVREVADHLDRTEHATEALLVRARRAFRAAYEGGETP